MDIWGILEYTVSISVIGLLIWLVKRIFHDKLDARWHYFIWLVLLVRLLVPVDFQLIVTPFSVFREIPVGKWIAMGRLLAEKRGYGAAAVRLGQVWFWGAVLLGSFYLILWVSLRIRIARAPRADAFVREYVDGIAGKYGLKTCRDIRMLKGSSPYICGVIHPVLVLPENIEVSFSGRSESEARYGPDTETTTKGLEMQADCEGLKSSWQSVNREGLKSSWQSVNREGLKNSRQSVNREGLKSSWQPVNCEGLKSFWQPVNYEGLKGCGQSVNREGLKSSGQMANKGVTEVPTGRKMQESMYTEYEPLPQEAVILHELLHRKFGDVLVNLAVHLVRVVNWFNPVIWLLTATVLNDGEALCDQRVLELSGKENAHAYGELLISMSEGKKRNPVKAGTSNMAGSYRNMRTRILRIRDFQGVPKGVGLVALCITLMLALAGISSSAEEGYVLSPIRSRQDLELALLQARLYHARTPEEAVYLFLRAHEENNVVYRMMVLPEQEMDRYEEFAVEWFERRETAPGSVFHGREEGYPAYFPEEDTRVDEYDIYNLQYEEKEGQAVVHAAFHGSDGPLYAVWELSLVKENGWKVWLESESETTKIRPEPEILLSCSRQMGDFLVEIQGYNQGYFNGLGALLGGVSGYFQWEEITEKQRLVFPESFTWEYKYLDRYITYLGEEDLEGHQIRVEIISNEEGGSLMPEAETAWEQERLWAGDGKEPESGNGESVDRKEQEFGNGEVVDGYGDSKGNYCAVFDGKKLMAREPYLVGGGGNGFTESGWCWKAGDRIQVQVQIFVDDVLWEEGAIWSDVL